jgi:dUTP pyrophosphatase
LAFRVPLGVHYDGLRTFLHYPRHVPELVEVLVVAEQVPAYSHPGDAGADLSSTEAVMLLPGARATIGTGVSIALPNGFVAFVVPRSGLAAKHGITVVNSPGTVDAGYRGEIRVTLLNTDSAEPYSVAVGDRIAQIVIMPVTRARFVPVETLPGSHRGVSGFGSTGYTTPIQGERA